MKKQSAKEPITYDLKRQMCIRRKYGYGRLTINQIVNMGTTAIIAGWVIYLLLRVH